MNALVAHYREVGPCPPGRCYWADVWEIRDGTKCIDGCFAARALLTRRMVNVEAPELFGESPVPAPSEPGDDIEPALGERWICDGCGAEHWEHDEDDDWSCCDWRPWED